MKLAIKMNGDITPDPCPLCGQVINPNIGPELTLACNERIVCRTCGRTIAPALVTMLELEWIAEDLFLCVQDFGDAWRASMK
jgi:hypothetical protein